MRSLIAAALVSLLAIASAGSASFARDWTCFLHCQETCFDGTLDPSQAMACYTGCMLGCGYEPPREDGGTG